MATAANTTSSAQTNTFKKQLNKVYGFYTGASSPS